ncbi:MAG: DUF2207 domain-containing protein, partial [Anaerolineae bacterium]|nr:DUF2207 domain-containing protein [Thermoflexales bacterium]MDW8408510.1 DUF2207 domain-containing protein [Anaerolineae bacterium]
LDTEVTVLPSGDLRVVETNVIDFTEGTFTFGYRDIDSSRLTDVVDVMVTEQGRVLPVDFSRPEEGYYRIRYEFEPASQEQRVFTLEYTVRGATRYYDDGDEVFWAGVYADRNGFAVQSSRVTVRLPDGVRALDVQTYGPRAEVRGRGENIIVAEALEPIPSGDQFEVWVKFPHGAIAGSAPPWQAGYDALRAYQRTSKPIVDMVVLTLALLVVGIGVPAALVTWYRRGRDPHVGAVAEYLSEPPADLSPGLAGTLLDEKVEMRDVIATLIDLCRRGVLVMREEHSPGLLGLGTQRDWVFEAGPNFDARLASHERALINALDVDVGDEVSLSSLQNLFYKRLPSIEFSLYKQLVSAGYYQRRPDQVRNRYTTLAIVGLVAALVVFVVGSILASEGIVSTLIWLGVGLGVVGGVWLLTAMGMPVRTRKGAEMRARVEAFKRYLQDIERYTNLHAAIAQFERYLPFAVAFGVERGWMNKFAEIDAPAPSWYTVRFHAHSSDHFGDGPSSSTMPGAARAPSGGLAGANSGLTASLASMNAGLTAMMSSAASTFSSSPSSSGGGGGGGGGSSGGGGGGFG